MTDLKIRVFKSDEEEPDTTITIPGKILKIASTIIPKKLAEKLQEEGIDIDEIIRLSENPDAQGTLVEVEEHKKNKKITSKTVFTWLSILMSTLYQFFKSTFLSRIISSIGFIFYFFFYH